MQQKIVRYWMVRTLSSEVPRKLLGRGKCWGIGAGSSKPQDPLPIFWCTAIARWMVCSSIDTHLDLQAEQSASRQLGRKGERKGGSFEQGGARPTGRAFGQSVRRWGDRYTSAEVVQGRVEHEEPRSHSATDE